jgi:hypothetical protein
MVNQAKNKIFSVCIRDFHHEHCAFSWTDIHKKCSTTTHVYWEDGKSDIHVFSWQETPLENGIFSLFGTRFHLEEPIFSRTSINTKYAGHRDVSFTPIKNQLYIGQKVKALPLPFCQFFEILFKCQLSVNFSFLYAFHMKYLRFLKDMLIQNVSLC